VRAVVYAQRASALRSSAEGLVSLLWPWSAALLILQLGRQRLNPWRTAPVQLASSAHIWRSPQTAV